MFADTRRAQPLVWPPYLVNSIRPATATQWLSADSASLAADGMRFARVCDYDLALGAGGAHQVGPACVEAARVVEVLLAHVTEAAAVPRL